LLSHESVPISDLNNVINVSDRAIRNNLNVLHKKKIIVIHVDLEDLRKKIVKLNKETELLIKILNNNIKSVFYE
jgi:DNA-binding MarR family transcriptional regulator